jgi:hypothetical protein
MTHPTSESALRLAREALESCTPGDYSTGHFIHPSFDEELVNRALEALAAAVAQATEPVGRAEPSDIEEQTVVFLNSSKHPAGTPVYAEPVEARPGWKLVPVEATHAMAHVNPDMLHPRIAKAVYQAMLAAAPTPEPVEARQDEADFEVYVMHDDEVEHYASTYGPRARALAEAMHYARQATGDGIAEVVEIVKRRVWIDPRAVHPTPDAAGEPITCPECESSKEVWRHVGGDEFECRSCAHSWDAAGDPQESHQ